MVEIAILGVAAYGLVELVSRGALTRTIWALGRWAFWLADAGALALVARVRPPRFAVLGRCYRCGECCRMIVARPPRLVRETTLLLRVFVLYHRSVHAFCVAGRGPGGEVIFACGHLRNDGRCGIYARRPLLCRRYPARPFFELPRLLPACSYRVAPLAVARMKARPGLRVVNPGVTVHHPTRAQAGELGRDEDYEWIDDTEDATGQAGQARGR